MSVRIGDTVVPLVAESRCHCCSSPIRYDIERMLCEGRTSKAIARSLPDAGVSADNIKDHYNAEHMPVQSAAVQEVATRQGRDLAQAFEPAVSALADHLTLASQIVARVRERLASGDEEPTIRDGLAAIRLLAETESVVADQRGVEEYVSAMIALVETVRDHVSGETYAAIGRDLAANPLLRPIAAGRPD